MHNFHLIYFSTIFIVLSACSKDVPESYNLDCNDSNSGLVLNYSFNDQSGFIATDCTPKGLDGSLYGVTWAIENGHTAIEFDGNDTLDISSFCTGSKVQYEPKYGTLSVTFKFRDFDGNIQPIVYYGESDSLSIHNSMIIEVGHKMDINNRKLYFTIVNARFCFDSNMNLEEDTWYHFVAVVSAEGNTGYLNGVELTDRNYNLGSNSSYTDFFLSVPVREVFALGYGRYGMCSDFFYLNGYIGDFRLYDRPLTSDEVYNLYLKLL